MSPMAQPGLRHRRGFTLVELMVALAVLAILVSIGLPSFRDLIVSQRVRAASSALYDTLIFARSEAIKRNTTVSLIVTDLASGWTVTSGGTTLRRQEGFSGLVFDPNKPDIKYNPYGRLASGAGSSISVTADGGSKTRWICIDSVGRPHVFDGACP